MKPLKKGTDINNIKSVEYRFDSENTNTPKLGGLMPTQQMFEENPELI